MFWLIDMTLIIGSPGSGKTNTLPNLIKREDENYSIIDNFLYMLRIHMKQSINILLRNVKI